MGGEFWSEDDERAERLDELKRARLAAHDAARAREDAVAGLPFVLRQASRAVDQLLRRTLDARGLTISLTGLDLLALARAPLPVVVLADKLKITPQATSQVVAQLKAVGLVEKERGYLDRRVMVVETTDEGCELLARVKEVVEDALNYVADDLAVGRLPGLTEELADLAEVDRDRDPWGMW